jgi:hypothetical protein
VSRPLGPRCLEAPAQAGIFGVLGQLRRAAKFAQAAQRLWWPKPLQPRPSNSLRPNDRVPSEMALMTRTTSPDRSRITRLVVPVHEAAACRPSRGTVGDVWVSVLVRACHSNRPARCDFETVSVLFRIYHAGAVEIFRFTFGLCQRERPLKRLLLQIGRALGCGHRLEALKGSIQ